MAKKKQFLVCLGQKAFVVTTRLACFEHFASVGHVPYLVQMRALFGDAAAHRW